MGFKDWFKPKNIQNPVEVKGGSEEEKMEQEIEEIEDLDNDEAEELEAQDKPIQVVKRGRPTKTSKPNPASQEPQQAQERYAAYSQQADEGLLDTLKNEKVTNNLWVALASIKNDLEEIKRGVLG